MNRSAVLKKKSKFTGAGAGKLLLSLFFVVAVLVPLIRMFCNITPESIKRAFGSPLIGQAILNSVVSSLLATLLTLVLAYIAAVCMERVDIKLKKLFSILFILPMLIPSISHGMGLVILFGNNGVITRLFKLGFNIYGLYGIIFGSVLYSFPVAFLMLSDVMHYEDKSPYEAARVLGLNGFRRFSVITMPYLRKPLISVIFSVFTMIITDYGVPLTVGGKYRTVASVMYQEVIGQLDFGKGAVYGSLLLIPAVAAFIFDALNRDKGNNTYSQNPPECSEKGLFKALAYIFCIVISIVILLPIAASCILAFAKDYPINMTPTLEGVGKAFNLGAGRYLLNSFIIALSVSALGIVVAFITAYFTARLKTGLSRFLHLASITTAAIPGVVLGLSYVLTFKESVIYGTLIILIMVNTMHFFASPYLMMYNSLSKLNENLEAVGSTLGVSRIRMIKDVIIPQSIGTIAEMFSYFFVNCMMTISAVSFLATTKNKPVALMISQFEAQMQLEYAAFVSLSILTVNLLMKGIIYLVKKYSKRIGVKKHTVKSEVNI